MAGVNKGDGSGVGDSGGESGSRGGGGRRGEGDPAVVAPRPAVPRGPNAALVLDLLRTAGEAGISRLELAEHAGLTPQAVSKITARLRADGLVAEAGHRASTGGKPRTVLRLVPSAAQAVGVHLDRDELTVVLVDLAGTPVAARSVPLDLGAGTDRVIAAVVEQVAAVRGAARAVRGEARAVRGDGLLGVGVAMPGPLDHTTGVPRRVTGFPQWNGVPLRDTLAARLGFPVVLDKDTNAAALGLALRGPADTFAYLHLGTGLGAGLVIDGELHRGARTGAGEFGHQVIHLDGPACDCGNRGCIEAICLAAVARGDLAGAARVLGAGAANLIGLLDIDRILLGGRTVTAHEERFVRGVAAVVAERARCTSVQVTAAAGGGAHPVAEGAAQLVLAPVFGRAEGSRGRR
ncbi:ROK family transcriptional regulator [Streptomyces sp. NRRL F-5135]|uniref:ROK family transcriptional regulator n=1 Tax=Streptomyces sp. NRRL F-5135 TaxID=1463858 RepID=UPI00099D9A84|nr:ROK family transcriptional regulator [Streptomyces sp. NRRL F-5135]